MGILGSFVAITGEEMATLQPTLLHCFDFEAEVARRRAVVLKCNELYSRHQETEIFDLYKNWDILSRCLADVFVDDPRLKTQILNPCPTFVGSPSSTIDIHTRK